MYYQFLINFYIALGNNPLDYPYTRWAVRRLLEVQYGIYRRSDQFFVSSRDLPGLCGDRGAIKKTFG